MAPALALSLAAAATLATGEGMAATRTHTHRASVAAIPASSLAETPSLRDGRKRKAGARAASGSPSGSSSTKGASKSDKTRDKSGKGHHGHKTQPEPADDATPMYRTSHRVGRPGAPDPQLSGRVADAPTTHGRVGKDHAPILVDSRGRPVSRARFLAMRAHSPALHWAAPPHESASRHASTWLAASSSPRVHHSSAASASPSGYAYRSSSAASVTTDRRSSAFAEGVSQPDAAENVTPDPASFSQVKIGTAMVMTGNNAHLQPTTPLPGRDVVQGFGAEIALAPADPGTRPGGTRRRDHPLAATAMLPTLQPAPSLEERAAITEGAVSPAVLPEIYDRTGRLVMPAPLKGSREVLVHQNTMANNEGLERIQDDGDLDRLRAEHALVSFPVSGSLRLNEDLPSNRRCARPWTVLFATDIAHDFYERFHQPLQVNSAVRTVAYQARLQRINGNAAATGGEGASPHLTGQAIDLGKRGMSAAQLAWMRAYLVPLIVAGTIDVEEEFQQSCFHISVYRRYAAARTPVHEVAQVRPAVTHAADAAGAFMPNTP